MPVKICQKTSKNSSFSFAASPTNAARRFSGFVYLAQFSIENLVQLARQQISLNLLTLLSLYDIIVSSRGRDTKNRNEKK